MPNRWVIAAAGVVMQIYDLRDGLLRDLRCTVTGGGHET